MSHSDTFKITIHMVSSLDGMIAKNDNSVSWFETNDRYENGVEAPDAQQFLNAIDCYVMGARTYEHALELSKSYGWPYGDTPTVVLSHRNLPIERDNVEVHAGDLKDFVEMKLKPKYKNVWMVGGPMLAREFIRLHLADEIRLSILPIILGDGKKFFHEIGQEHPLHLKNVTAYKNAVVDLTYQLLNPEKENEI